MEWSWPEIVLSNREVVMEELIQGSELASQLRRVLDDRSFVSGGDGVASAKGLLNKILGSFANTLIILNGKESAQELVSDHIEGNSGGGSSGGAADSSSWDGQNHDDDHAVAIKSEGSQEESCKSASTFIDLRGSYKRRKTSHSWIRDTPALTDDGHAWRTYGQKAILNAEHPRNYFSCTHKLDQACQATKHEQKVQDDPPLFRTTYYENHTCRDYLKASELVLDCSSPIDSSKFISFAQTNVANKQEHHFFSSFASSVKKEVIIKEDIPIHDHHMMNHSPSCDYLVSPDLTVFESSGPLSGFSSTIDYDQDDVISGMLVGSYNNFDDEKFCNLNFDF